MRVDHSTEALAITLPPRSFAQEIRILRDKYAAKFRRPLQQAVIIK
jgi:hypothetical protein